MKHSKWTWKNVDLPEEIATRLGLEFEAGLLEASLAPVWSREAQGPATSRERDVELLSQLGDIYSRLGLLQKGLEVDETLVRLRPHEPLYHYNLACSHSRLGHVESALAALKEAIRLGYQNFEHLRNDSDLDNLKRDKRFQALLRQLEAGR
ncbi:MAG TPA: tetratricopeptide repeat protein [Planctomycetota bacterium]|nr:tetratricopeptide repeat protein [Planctomycetota bacterium]